MNNNLQVIELKLSQEQYETIEDLAACNYAPRQMAVYLDCDEAEFMRQYYKPDSLVRFHFNKGVLAANFEVDQKLLENAKTGNITASQEYKKAAEKREFYNQKMRILNEG